MFRDKKIIVVSLIMLVLAAGGYFYIREKHPEILQNVTASQSEAIRAKAEKFINENLVSPGTQAQIKGITKEGGMYKILVGVEGQELTAYISQDGKNFFPQAFDMDGSLANETPSEQSAQAVPEQEVNQADVPGVELFVMSYCPYGLQMEKGLLPAVKLLGSKINFSLKFVDYAMHGDKEIQENLRQHCIGRQGTDKLENYLDCFVLADDSAACLARAGINAASLDSCVVAADAQYKITENAANQALWINGYPPFDINKEENLAYNVGGSPTFVINGTVVSTARDPRSLLSLICSAFSEQPGECGQQLSGDVPVAGFGEGTASGSAPTSDCGS